MGQSDVDRTGEGGEQVNGKNKRWAEICWESRQEERLQRMADKKLKQMERQKLAAAESRKAVYREDR